MTTHDNPWLTVDEAARELRVSVPTVRRWIRGGRLAASRVGERSIRIRRDDLRMVSRPATAGPSAKHAGEMLRDEHGLYIDQGDPTLTTDELLAMLRRHQKAILDRRGGVPLPDSAPLIRQIREERGDDL